jgi:pimeloyl-ACP methyl ester carboxylesterase
MKEFFFCLLLSLLPAISLAEVSTMKTFDCQQIIKEPFKGGGSSRWNYCEGEAKGVVVLVHGLNVSVTAMQDLACAINELGYHVLSPVLAESGSAESWIESVKRSYCAAKLKFPDLPINGVGHSAGGASILAFMAKYQNRYFDAVVLLAPALSITRASWVVRPLTPLRYLGLSLPSFSPKKHKRSSFTPLGAYNALFDLASSLQDLKKGSAATLEGFASARGVVLISPADGLVRYNGVKRWLKEQNLKWRLVTLRPQHTNGLIADHLLFDKETMGKSWEKMLKIMQETLTYYKS